MLGVLNYQAARGDARDVQMLLEESLDPNAQTESGFENGDGWGELEFQRFTPLHFAAANGNVDAARLLLQYGANPRVYAGMHGNRPISHKNKESSYIIV